jgi:hypothetical protein
VQSTLHVKTKVLPGNKIEISLPELKEGDPVEVFLLLPEGPTIPPRSALEIIEGLSGHRLFQSPQEVDRYLQGERNSWDR